MRLGKHLTSHGFEVDYTHISTLYENLYYPYEEITEG
jgi:hypothetical protein